MVAKDINNVLKRVIVQNGTSIVLYNLNTHNTDFKVVAEEHKDIVNLLKDILSGVKNDSPLIAKDCVKIINDFTKKINDGVPSGECYILIKNEGNEFFYWTHLTYTLDYEEKSRENIAVISIKDVDDAVDDRLIDSFWHKAIMNGIAKGNSYFIIDLDDEFILDSCGRFAIKTKNFKEQVDYIAGLCCDGMEQKLRCVLSKDNLMKLYDEDNTDGLMDVLIQDLDGIQRWFKIKVVFTKNLIGDKTFAHITFSDIDVKYRASEDIKYNATHDVLTGVLNRHTFVKMVTQNFDELNTNYWNALIFIDIDDFKKVNDVLGHVVGDRVLRGVAKGIKKSFRAGDTIGRIGGDEFMVLFSAPTLYALYSRLNLLNTNIKEASKIDSISVSFGITIFTGIENDFDKLYHLSDKAMYDAKNSGKSRYCIVDEYGNDYLSDWVSKIDSIKFSQMLKMPINDLVFCTNGEDGIAIDYATPKIYRKLFNEKKIRKMEEIKKYLSEKDYEKLVEAINNSVKLKEMSRCTINVKGQVYKIAVLSSNGKIIVGATSR